MNILRNGSIAAQVTGLVTAALGILILFVVGGVTGPVPVGTLMLATAAAVVAFAPWRWAPVLGLAVTLYLIVGFVLNETSARLSTQAGEGALVGSLALALGLFVAAVGGVVSSIRSYLDPSGKPRMTAPGAAPGHAAAHEAVMSA